MSNKRVEMHRLQEVVRLHRLGTASREVAKPLSLNPNTERWYRKALECVLAGVNPEQYLADVIDKIAADWPAARADELLPRAWRAAREAERDMAGDATARHVAGDS